MADTREVQRLVTAHAAVRERLAASAAASARQQARVFTGWFDTAAVTVMAASVADQVEAAQRQTAAVTDAYLARVLTLITGRPSRPVGPVDVTGLRQGITHPGVYGRLADQYRYDVYRGTDAPATLEHLLTRAESLARTDVDLAFRAQVHKSLAKAPVSGYRRVVHPELSRSGTCGLCIAASHRMYHKAELLPLHDNCRCGVVPAHGDDDPGQLLNTQDLEALYDAAGSTAAADLKRVRVSVHDHGEIGPVLRERGQGFRGPRDVRPRHGSPRRDDRGRIELTREQIEFQIRSLSEHHPGGQSAFAQQWQRDRLGLLREQLSRLP